MSGTDLVQPADIHNLYSNHHHWLLGVLRRRVGCYTTAQDLSHDVFVRLLGKSELPAFQEPRAYLARVAHGLVIDRHRRQVVERAWLETLTAMPCNDVPSAEEQILIIDALARIDALLDTLNPRVRQIFLLSRLEGIAYADIAQQLDVSLSTVKKDMTKALRHCYHVLMD